MLSGFSAAILLLLPLSLCIPEFQVLIPLFSLAELISLQHPTWMSGTALIFPPVCLLPWYNLKNKKGWFIF